VTEPDSLDPQYRFERYDEVETWQETLREALASKLSIERPSDDHPPFQVGPIEDRGECTARRLTIDVPGGGSIPGYVVVPDGTGPHPVMICLQGHAPGMYLSLGEERTGDDAALIEGGRDFAEQAGFGERAHPDVECHDLALRQLLRGESLLGQRVADVLRGVDVIAVQDELDERRVGILGHSSGGTTGFFAGALDERIGLVVCSCSFCTYERSWLSEPHCACGYVPGILELGDMSDLAGLIAPRGLVVVAGQRDDLADVDGVREGYDRARKYYGEYTDRLQLVVGDGGHRFYPDAAWPIVESTVDRLGW
jgi:hypothetical protein